MSEEIYNRLSVVQQLCVDTFIEGEDASEESKQMRKWVKRVWWGTSSIRAKDEVKRLCRGTVEGKAATAWDNANKRWGTHLVENVPCLIASGLWLPDGIDPKLADVVAMRISAALKRDKAHKMRNETPKMKRGEAKHNAKGVGGGNVKLAMSEGAATKPVPPSESKLGKTKLDTPTPARRPQESDPEPKRTKYATPGSFLATEEEIREVWQRYGLDEAIFRQTSEWSWLGPTCNCSMTRIERWFNFSHNKARGIETVRNEDFYAYAQKVAEERTKMGREPVVSTEPTTNTSDVDTFDRLKRKEQARVKSNQAAADARKWDEEHGPHALALKALAENCAKMPPIKHTLVFMCPLCNVKPLEQFMECGCMDNSSRDWKQCYVCNVIFHPTKIPCHCV